VTTDALLGRRDTKAAQRAAEVTLLYGGDRARSSELKRLAHHLEGLSPATLRALRQIVVAFRRERGV
jgi:hypothetical protein